MTEEFWIQFWIQFCSWFQDENRCDKQSQSGLFQNVLQIVRIAVKTVEWIIVPDSCLFVCCWCVVCVFFACCVRVVCVLCACCLQVVGMGLVCCLYAVVVVVLFSCCCRVFAMLFVYFGCVVRLLFMGC